MPARTRKQNDDGVQVHAGLVDPVTDHYAMIPNAVLRDYALSTDARAILCEWLSHTRAWKVDLRHTARQNGLTYERVRRAVKELREAGYVHFVKVSGGRAAFDQWYLVGNRRDVKCSTSGCVDCGIGTPKTATRTDLQEQGVSAGRIGLSNYGVRKTGVQEEDHSTEDCKKTKSQGGTARGQLRVVDDSGHGGQEDEPKPNPQPKPKAPAPLAALGLAVADLIGDLGTSTQGKAKAADLNGDAVKPLNMALATTQAIRAARRALARHTDAAVSDEHAARTAALILGEADHPVIAVDRYIGRAVDNHPDRYVPSKVNA